MNSQILTGELVHARTDERKHAFAYPVHMLWLDVDELPLLEKTTRWFGYNRRRLFAIHDRDFLTNEQRPIREKLAELLSERNIPMPDGRLMLLTCARYFNYVFNPVSFYYAYDRNDQLACVVAEVNNTFSEKHLYVLDESTRLPSDEGAHFARAKQFHVSPFMDLGGQYDFHFRFPGQGLEVDIRTLRKDRQTFLARLTGTLQPLTSTHLRNVCLRYPLTGLMTMTRIFMQAVRLYFKGATVYERPTPATTDTIGQRTQSGKPPFAARLVIRMMKQFTHGRLMLSLPDGTTHVLGNPESTESITMEVKDWRFFSKVVSDGDIGLGESYMAGDWTVNDLTAFMRMLIRNREAISQVDDGALHRRIAHRMLAWARRNTVSGSRRNIAHHYDLSNALYEAMLDPTMTYSAAYFERPEQSLEDAQLAKYRRICEKIGLRDGDHVLEIGCGWGGFARFAATYADCRITAVTVSKEQYEYACARVKQEGLSDRITVVLEDYRKIDGTYDKIVSIEMFEAVGHEYYGTYFKTCDHLLKPDGVFLMQAISIPDQSFDAYRKSYDWIRKYIFPGGCLPSVEAITRAARLHSSLVVQDLENIGDHYATTLRMWRARFLENIDAVRDLGFDIRFERMWLFYLCYCEAAFEARYLGDLQVVLSKPLRAQALARV